MKGYEVSTDRSRLDVKRVTRFLSEVAYWSHGISEETVKRSIDNSLPFGVYQGEEQIGFARVITDYATFAYVADVYIEEPHRGSGAGTLLMQTVVAHPELQNLRRWMLVTRDAHRLYEKVGFTNVATPERFMEKRRA